MVTTYNSETHYFDSIEAFDAWLLAFEADFIENASDKSVTWRSKHSWFHYIAPYKQEIELKRYAEKGVKLQLVWEGNEPLDHESRDFYKNCGVNVKLGVQLNTPQEIGIYGDTVIKLLLPADLENAIDLVFKTCKSGSQIDVITLLSEIIKKKANPEIEVTVIKDVELATSILKK